PASVAAAADKGGECRFRTVAAGLRDRTRRTVQAFQRETQAGGATHVPQRMGLQKPAGIYPGASRMIDGGKDEADANQCDGAEPETPLARVGSSEAVDEEHR